MAHRAGKKEESKARILTSAGRGFRSRGFGGSGIDGLAKDAAVTSGAFYAHFKSKAAAFREAVVVGLEELRLGIGQAREQMGTNWREWFIDFYMGERRTCDLAESCALQSLSSEVARADDETRQAYETELGSIIEAVAAGLEGKPKARYWSVGSHSLGLSEILRSATRLLRPSARPRSTSALMHSLGCHFQIDRYQNEGLRLRWSVLPRYGRQSASAWRGLITGN
jgi:TetR/AcrR family transcriptional repressor of nem operon